MVKKQKFTIYIFLALKTRLEETGEMGKLKAYIRAEIFKLLDTEQNEKKPIPDANTVLVQELIKECLQWLGYKHSLSIFLQESGHTTDKLDKKILATELHVPHVYAEHPDVYVWYNYLIVCLDHY